MTDPSGCALRCLRPRRVHMRTPAPLTDAPPPAARRRAARVRAFAPRPCPPPPTAPTAPARRRRGPVIRPYALAALRSNRRYTGVRAFAGTLRLVESRPATRPGLAGVVL
ncbi:hypothetical protein GCM10009834_34090 [Streptomonospora arabica]